MMTFTLLVMVFAAVMLLTATLGLCALGLPPREREAPRQRAPGAAWHGRRAPGPSGAPAPAP